MIAMVSVVLFIRGIDQDMVVRARNQQKSYHWSQNLKTLTLEPQYHKKLIYFDSNGF